MVGSERNTNAKIMEHFDIKYTETLGSVYLKIN